MPSSTPVIGMLVSPAVGYVYTIVDQADAAFRYPA